MFRHRGWVIAAVMSGALAGCSSQLQIAHERLKARVKPFVEQLEEHHLQRPTTKLTCDTPMVTEETAEGFTGMLSWVANGTEFKQPIEGHTAFFKYRTSDGVWRLDHVTHRIAYGKDVPEFTRKDGPVWDEFALFTDPPPCGRQLHRLEGSPVALKVGPGWVEQMTELHNAQRRAGVQPGDKTHVIPTGSGTIDDPYVATTTAQELEAMLACESLKYFRYDQLLDESSPWRTKPTPK